MTPGRLVSELTVTCVRVTLCGARGAASLIDVDVIAVAAQSLRAVGHVTVAVLTTCQSRTTARNEDELTQYYYTLFSTHSIQVWFECSLERYTSVRNKILWVYIR